MQRSKAISMPEKGFPFPKGQNPARDALIGASAILGSAFVLSHLYFLVRGKRPALCSFLRLLSGASGGGRIHYPVTRRSDKLDIYHGVKVPDPYNWLEDPDSPEVKEWVRQQNKATDSYFVGLKADKEKFQVRMNELYHYDKYSCMFRKGDRYFFYKKEGLQNQHILYTQDSLTGSPRVLIDPNALREDGTAALSSVYLTDDGNKLAYMISFSGSDWQTIFVMDVATGKPYKDEVHWCKFSSVAWTKDGQGFFYAKYPAPSSQSKDDGAGTETEASASQKVYYHRVGTSEEEDKLFFESPENPKWLYGVEMTDDGETLLLTMNESCDPVNRLYYFDVRKFDGNDMATIGRCVKLVDHFEHKYDYVTNDGKVFYFRTNREAPKYKVVKVKLPNSGDPIEKMPSALAALRYQDVVPMDQGVLNEAQAVAGKFLLLTYLRDVVDELEICPLAGGNRTKVPLPGKGSLDSVSARKKLKEFFFKYSSFNDPGTVYRAELIEGEKVTVKAVPTSLVFRSEIAGLNPDEYKTSQVFYTSKDGTKVPMFIVEARKSPPGPRPTFLYGYGGFNISICPSFSISRLLYIRHFGGIVAIANIRGGGEYGEEWHNGGTKQNKQNVFDDFISAAEYLVEKGITTPKQIAINGGSNGGLLVAACINQRPDLFGAAVTQVGVLDMLKFHKFTIGYAWCSDYGNAEDNEADFKTLYAYSPVHNVNKSSGVTYPATLITTGDHDDRVVPLHSYKYIAALQYSYGNNPEQTRPLVIRIDTKAGHGAGKPTSKLIEEQSDVFAFIAANTVATWKD